MQPPACPRRRGSQSFAAVSSVLISSLWVGAGGFLGAVLRYGLQSLVQRQVPEAIFPYGTLAVNVLGCLAIGLLVGLLESRQLLGPELRGFVLIGVLGGFTTFSTFGYETFALANAGDLLRASANVGAHVLLGLPAVWLGYTLTRP